ncbi:MAG: hypothetical protein ACP5FK_10455 [bacterium]
MYSKILGLTKNWEVTDVRLDLNESKVEVQVEYTGKEAEYPECGKSCSIYDHAPERRWRHLDTC